MRTSPAGTSGSGPGDPRPAPPRGPSARSLRLGGPRGDRRSRERQWDGSSPRSSPPSTRARRTTGSGPRWTSRAPATASGARRDRTDDLLLAKQALSQLSYGPARRRFYRGGRVSHSSTNAPRRCSPAAAEPKTGGHRQRALCWGTGGAHSVRLPRIGLTAGAPPSPASLLAQGRVRRPPAAA